MAETFILAEWLRVCEGEVERISAGSRKLRKKLRILGDLRGSKRC